MLILKVMVNGLHVLQISHCFEVSLILPIVQLLPELEIYTNLLQDVRPLSLVPVDLGEDAGAY